MLASSEVKYPHGGVDSLSLCSERFRQHVRNALDNMSNFQRQWWQTELLRDASLIFLAIIFLPLNVFLLALCGSIAYLFSSQRILRRRIRASPGFRPKVILITDVELPQGLSLARSFYLAGHTVIGLDTQDNRIPSGARFSTALKHFYSVSYTSSLDGGFYYTEVVLHLILHEHVDLWINCGKSNTPSVIDCKRVIENTTKCRVIHIDTQHAARIQDKASFASFTRSLGLPSPDSHALTSRVAIHDVLKTARTSKKSYIVRGYGTGEPRKPSSLLPRRSLSQTYNQVSQLPVSKTNPVLIQEHIRGDEYTTHSLVIDGEVAAFAAHPGNSKTTFIVPLSSRSPLAQSMMEFTRRLTSQPTPSAGGIERKMTGHLSIIFRIQSRVTESGVESSLYPISCNTGVPIGSVLLRGQENALARAYIHAHDNIPEKLTNGVHPSDYSYRPTCIRPKSTKGYYFLGREVFDLLLRPLARVINGNGSLSDCSNGITTFLQRVARNKEMVWEMWDPMPFLWLYETLPLRLLLGTDENSWRAWLHKEVEIQPDEDWM